MSYSEQQDYIRVLNHNFRSSRKHENQWYTGNTHERIGG
jgi:hypothetical protein